MFYGANTTTVSTDAGREGRVKNIFEAGRYLRFFIQISTNKFDSAVRRAWF
jgi:hypothetical protein